jgi:vacuolar-type H+-ATPase subunit B/Vma2
MKEVDTMTLNTTKDLDRAIAQELIDEVYAAEEELLDLLDMMEEKGWSEDDKAAVKAELDKINNYYIGKGWGRSSDY